MMVLIIILSCAFLALAWRRLDLALAVVLFALPSYQIRFNVGIPTNLLEVLVWLLFLTWLVRNRYRVAENITSVLGKSSGNNKIAYPFQWEMIGWLIIGLISAGVAGFNNSALGIFKAYFFEPILFYLVVVNVISALPNVVSRWRLVVWPLATSASLVGLVSVYQYITGNLILNPFWSAEATRRATGLFGYPNAVGLYVELIIFLSLGYLFLLSKPEDAKKRNMEKLGIGLSIGLSLLAVVLAKSVGAALGVGVGLLVFFWLVNHKWRTTIVVAVVVASIFIALVPSLRQIATTQLTLTSFSGQVRRAQWQETWQMLQSDKHWLVGAGLSGYQTAIAPYHTPGIFVYDYSDPDSHRKMVWNEAYRKAHWQPVEIYMYPHNIILNFWTEIGLVGLLLFVWLIGRLIFLSVRLFRRNSLNENRFVYAGLVSAVFALLIHGLVDVPYFKNDLSLLFWLIVALISVPIIELKLANK